MYGAYLRAAICMYGVPVMSCARHEDYLVVHLKLTRVYQYMWRCLIGLFLIAYMSIRLSFLMDS